MILGADVDFRLVVQHELVIDERCIEVMDGFESGEVRFVELEVVALDSARAGLGRVHCEVGPAQQLGDADSAAIDFGDTDAGGDAHARSVVEECPRDPVEDSRGRRHRIVAGLEGDQECELIASQPYEHVGIADAGGEPPGRLAQQLVAG